MEYYPTRRILELRHAVFCQTTESTDEEKRFRSQKVLSHYLSDHLAALPGNIRPAGSSRTASLSPAADVREGPMTSEGAGQTITGALPADCL